MKQSVPRNGYRLYTQPPSGGCVLKLVGFGNFCRKLQPAAFGRLCVETGLRAVGLATGRPAAFGRLCVETKSIIREHNCVIPAAFGRLCVETVLVEYQYLLVSQPPSGGCVLKLPARTKCGGSKTTQPPSGGCVLKRRLKQQRSLSGCQPPSGGCVLKRGKHGNQPD